MNGASDCFPGSHTPVERIGGVFALGPSLILSQWVLVM